MQMRVSLSRLSMDTIKKDRRQGRRKDFYKGGGGGGGKCYFFKRLFLH